MFGTVGFYVKSLSAYRAVDRLAREGIAVLSAREVQKNVLDLRIHVKDMKKAFAILQSSCYNIENVRYFGAERFRRTALRAAGLLAGALLFLLAVTFFEARVLAIEIVGNGAYYEREVRDILKNAGITAFSAMPSDTGAVTAQILSLPRVEFCSFKRAGGVLTVEVNCAENIHPIAGMPLTSPVTGTVEALVVVRGTPLVSIGDEVQAGDILIGDYLLRGEEQVKSIVIGKAVVWYPVSQEYELTEAGALAQALLDYGELTELHIGKTERGWLVEGVAHATVSLNLD